MGIKHMKIIRSLLSENSDQLYSVTEIRKQTGIFSGTITESLDYLIEDNKVMRMKSATGQVSYKWYNAGKD